MFFFREGKDCQCKMINDEAYECGSNRDQHCRIPCKRGEFHCPGSKRACVPEDKQCDMENDCGKWEDEKLDKDCRITKKYKQPSGIAANTKLIGE